VVNGTDIQYYGQGVNPSGTFRPTQPGIYAVEVNAYESSQCNYLCSAGKTLYRNSVGSNRCVDDVNDWTNLQQPCPSNNCIFWITVNSISITPSPSLSPTPTTSKTPRLCNQACNDSTGYSCQTGLVCLSLKDPDDVFRTHCRNPQCRDSEDCQCQVSPTPTPLLSLTPSPTLPPNELVCNLIRLYDQDWNQITNFNGLTKNRQIYLTTVGITNASSGVTKARFKVKINGTEGNWIETTSKHDDNFYLTYTIPSGGVFEIQAMVYSPSLGWR
jgi:hypothetical protein